MGRDEAGPDRNRSKVQTEMLPTHFFKALEAGGKFPHGTRDLRCNALLVGYLFRRSERKIPAEDLFVAFYKRPVKTVFGIVTWMERRHPDDPRKQTDMMLNWAAGQSGAERRSA